MHRFAAHPVELYLLVPTSTFDMSRKSNTPPEAVGRALHAALTTQSTLELRRALAVTLPAIHGLSLKETASLLGRSVTWVAKERQTFIHEPTAPTTEVRRGGRRNQLIPADEEDAFVEMICERYIRMKTAWRLPSVRSKIPKEKAMQTFLEFAHDELEQRIQRRTTRTTVYNLLARTGKRIFPAYEPHMWNIRCEKEVFKRYSRFVHLPMEERTPERTLSIINKV